MKLPQNGDIILFEAVGTIGICIGILTRSNVSHSAMVYDYGKMVEMGYKGIEINGFSEVLPNDTDQGYIAWFLRRNPSANIDKLIFHAKKYVDAGVRYDFPDLILLAGLLIYSYLPISKARKNVVIKILKLAAIYLDDILNSLIYDPDTVAMMCSQLVYQCHLDSGRDSWIHIPDAALRSTNLNEICIADFIDEDTLKVTMPPPLNSSVISEEQVKNAVDELHDLLIDSENTLKNDDSESLETMDQITQAATDFLERLNIVKHLSHIEGLQQIPLRAMFVTPADLLRSSNLEVYQEVKIRRIIENK